VLKSNAPKSQPTCSTLPQNSGPHPHYYLAAMTKTKTPSQIEPKVKLKAPRSRAENEAAMKEGRIDAHFRATTGVKKVPGRPKGSTKRKSSNPTKASNTKREELCKEESEGCTKEEEHSVEELS